MLPFRRILFPVDYSEPCRNIIPYVKEAVRHFSAELTLVHAYGPGSLAYLQPPVGSPDLASQIQGYEQKRLEEFARTCFGPETTRILQLGEPGGVIHNLVRDQGADLVMMPTEGHGPLRRMLLGSVTTKVLHDVSAAVWTATADALEAHPPAPYKSIVCGLQLGPRHPGDENAAVVVAAAALAKSYGARLMLAHIVDTPRTTFDVDFAPFLKELKDAASLQISELKSSLNVQAQEWVSDGNIATGMREAAEAAGADLMVLGRGHAQGGVTRLWSSLYAIVREAPCPVLSI
jgi:nucleotide-binding universal stress UspA family protein